MNPTVPPRPLPLPASPRGRSLLAAAAGLVLPAAFAPFHLWPLTLLSPALLLVLIHERSPREAFRLGLAMGAGTFLAGTYWLYHSLHVLGKAPLPVALLLMVGLVLIMGLYGGLTAWAIRRLAQRSLALNLLVIAPGTWVLVEWWRGWFLSGFPWLSLGYAHADAPLGGFAPLVGVYGISLAAAASAGALALLALQRSRAAWPALAVLVPLWAAALLLEQREWTVADGEQIRVAMVQGNVAQEDKWRPEQLLPTMDRYLSLTREHWDADLVVWPEAAIPELLHRYQEGFLSVVRAEAAASDTEVVFGALRRVDGLYYNSLITARGGDVYSKRHLVPFGEYFPVPAFVREWMRLMDLPYADIEAGGDDELLVRAGELVLGVTICYEDAYGQDQLRAAREADLLLNVSNDAWFGTSIAPHQHLQIARMRAREAGRPMIRTTNTGITALIGARGELLATLPQFETGVLRVAVRAHRGTTPFARWGEIPVVILALLMALLPSGLGRLATRD